MKQIRAGSRIREAALASSFKVSRARVHRVLQRLADLDVVEFRLNLGALVSRPSPQESQAVFRTPPVLEAEAGRAAALLCDEPALRALRAFFHRGIRALSPAATRLAPG